MLMRQVVSIHAIKLIRVGWTVKLQHLVEIREVQMSDKTGGEIVPVLSDSGSDIEEVGEAVAKKSCTGTLDGFIQVQSAEQHVQGVNNQQMSQNQQYVRKKPTWKKVYRHKYQSEWLKEYGITEVDQKVICVFCNWKVPESSMRPRRFQEHLQFHHTAVFDMSKDERTAAIMREFHAQDKQRSRMKNTLTLDEKVTVTSLQLAYVFARYKRPHTEGETVALEIMQVLRKTLFDDSPAMQKRLEMLPLSNDTVKRRLQLISSNLRDQLVAELNAAEFWAVAVDESTDFTDIPQLSVFVRFPAIESFKEEFLGLTSLRTTTTGVDICNAIISLCEEYGKWTFIAN